MGKRYKKRPIYVTLPRKSSRIIKFRSLKYQTSFQHKRSSRNKTHVNQLPSEVLLNIFSYLNTKELFCNVRCVCRRWRELAVAPILWKDIEADNSVPKEILETWIRKSSLLNSFSVKDRNDTNIILELVIFLKSFIVNYKSKIFSSLTIAKS